MTALEALLAFFTVGLALSIPLSAIITRRGSLIGQAIAERIRSKRAGGPDGASVDQLQDRVRELEETTVRQQQEIAQLEDEVSFMNRLLETRETVASPSKRNSH